MLFRSENTSQRIVFENIDANIDTIKRQRLIDRIEMENKSGQQIQTALMYDKESVGKKQDRSERIDYKSYREAV